MDDISPRELLRFVFPQIPSILKTAVWHTLWLSPTSTKWDLKTELMVNMGRKFLNPKSWGTISQQQAFTLKDQGIKGRMWISKVTLPAPPEDDLLQNLIAAVEGLKEEEGGREKYTVPRIENVTAEWTGYRANVHHSRPRPDLSEAQHYDKLMAEVSSEVTILYFHGGAFYLCDPSTHRIVTTKLARLTGGRCLSVRYRLSPQHAFPSALLDCFQAYLSLLSPPPGSFHTPVPPSKIIICGDSAGGNLALSLLQLLLHLNRHPPPASKPLTFHNHPIPFPLPLPAGVATNSAWTDLTRCLPSSITNLTYDFLPPPSPRKGGDNNNATTRFPTCALWPTDPARGDIYCDTSMLCHPLASPVIAGDWTGSCPLWFCYGEETLLDDGKMLAARAALQDVTVIWDEWEAMPHVFAQFMIRSPAGKLCFERWAGFCSAVAGEGGGGGGGGGEGGGWGEGRKGGGKGGGEAEGIQALEMKTRGVRFAVKTLARTEVDVNALAVMSYEALKLRMRDARGEGEGGGGGVGGEGKKGERNETGKEKEREREGQGEREREFVPSKL